jgi:hypothetical protein
MVPFAGLLWARVYAMSRHNEGMRWVIGSLGPLPYMGSLGTQGVSTLLFMFKSAIIPSSNTIRWQFIVVKNTCNLTGQDQVAFELWVTTAAVIFNHVHIFTLSGVRPSRAQARFQFNILFIPSEYNRRCLPYTFWHLGCCCDTLQYPWTHEALKRVPDAPSEVIDPNFGRTR